MNYDRMGAFIAILGGMVLVGSGLIARRYRWRRDGWKMAAAWAAIIVLMILAGHWLDRADSGAFAV